MDIYDDFIKFLKDKRLFYNEIHKVFSLSESPENLVSAFIAQQQVELLDEIISYYEIFVKEQFKNVEDLSRIC